MAGRTIRPGEAIPLGTLGLADNHELMIGLSTRSTAGSPPDLVALLLGENGRVRSDDDLIFYNNPTSLDRAVGHLGTRALGETVRIMPSALDADVTRVVLGTTGARHQWCSRGA